MTKRSISSHSYKHFVDIVRFHLPTKIQLIQTNIKHVRISEKICKRFMTLTMEELWQNVSLPQSVSGILVEAFFNQATRKLYHIRLKLTNQLKLLNFKWIAEVEEKRFMKFKCDLLCWKQQTNDELSIKNKKYFQVNAKKTCSHLSLLLLFLSNRYLRGYL